MRGKRTTWIALLSGAALVASAFGAQFSSAVVTNHTVKVGRDYGNSRAIVVTGGDRAVYRRSGETTRRILCTGTCTSKWPPVTVPSATSRLVRGAGIRGTLSKFRRTDGRWQVTLRGYPLYRFSPDHNEGDVRGSGQPGWYTLTP